MLPALKEMRMTRVSGSFLMASRETWRLASTMEPSSTWKSASVSSCVFYDASIESTYIAQTCGHPCGGTAQ